MSELRYKQIVYRKNTRGLDALFLCVCPTMLEHLKTTKAEGCQRCRLALRRNFLVFGEGPEKVDLMVVGEGPGEDENRTGRPFVGPAGNLLRGFLRKAGVKESSIYITNIVKCRPLDNREPEPDEIKACMPFLHLQIKILKPLAILAVGKVASATLSGYSLETSLQWLRDQDLIYSNKITGFSCSLVATYHPAYILRNKDLQPLVAKKAAKGFMDDLKRTTDRIALRSLHL